MPFYSSDQQQEPTFLGTSYLVSYPFHLVGVSAIRVYGEKDLQRSPRKVPIQSMLPDTPSSNEIPYLHAGLLTK